jgi:hypothetical protein
MLEIQSGEEEQRAKRNKERNVMKLVEHDFKALAIFCQRGVA